MLTGILISTLLFVGRTTSAPTTNASDLLTVDKSLLPDSLVVYTAEHEIVDIIVPINQLNFDDEESISKYIEAGENLPLFFVLADVKDNGDKIDQGLYILKDQNAKKLLDNGRDAAVDLGNPANLPVYFGAKDGLYVYNAEKNEAEKYGSLDYNIINIVKENGSDTFYILTETHELFKVTEKGTKSTPVDGVKNAQQIVIDMSNNLFYVGEDKNVYVLTSNGTKKMDYLPENPSFVRLARPPYLMDEGVPVVVDDSVYSIFPNGACDFEDVKLNVRPSAYGAEAALIQYYGFEKKIYKYNIVMLLLSKVSEQLTSFLESFKEFQFIATLRGNELGGQ